MQALVLDGDFSPRPDYPVSEMEKKTKITITILSVISIAGIAWFIYDKIKISRLNAKLSTPEEMQQTIDKKPKVINKLQDFINFKKQNNIHMENYKTRLPMIHKQTESLHEQFFSAHMLLNNIN